jgi:hypothetical protein
MEGAPNGLVAIALVAFVPITILCFLSLSPRRAMLASLLGGWLFLPWFDPIGRSFPLFHAKAVFVPAVVLSVALLLDLGAFRRLRPILLDLPVVAYCAIFAASSLHNDLGAYDAASAAFESGMTWAAPYLLGRAYFGSARSLRQLATGVVAGAMAYVPVCIWEIRMSPQLHRIVYGYQQHAFAQHVRFGGFRPMGFLYHGLMVALFMAVGALCAYWLWRTRAVRSLLGVPAGWTVLVLGATTLLCKSVGPIVLLLVAVAVLEGSRVLRSSALVLALTFAPVTYCGARLLGWSGRSVVEFVERHVDVERAASVADRLRSEDLLMARALERPWTGWGRWGQSRVRDEWGSEIAETDGLWIIALGVMGFPGLVTLGLIFAVPALALLWRRPARLWAAPAVSSSAVLATVVLVSAVDSLPNAMTMPILSVAAGAVLSRCAALAGASSRVLRRRVASAPVTPPSGAWEQSHDP